MNAARLDPLIAVAGLLLDARLAEMRRIQRLREESRARLADLAAAPAENGLPPVIAAQTALRYACWADLRRAEINMALARQTAEWLAAREAARLAFGRAEALQRLRDGRRG